MFLFICSFLKVFILGFSIKLIDNVVLVSGVQQSGSVIHIHVSLLFQIVFHFRLLQNIGQSSLCYTVDLCWLSIFNIPYDEKDIFFWVLVLEGLVGLHRTIQKNLVHNRIPYRG